MLTPHFLTFNLQVGQKWLTWNTTEMEGNVTFSGYPVKSRYHVHVSCSRRNVSRGMSPAGETHLDAMERRCSISAREITDVPFSVLFHSCTTNMSANAVSLSKPMIMYMMAYAHRYIPRAQGDEPYTMGSLDQIVWNTQRWRMYEQIN